MIKHCSKNLGVSRFMLVSSSSTLELRNQNVALFETFGFERPHNGYLPMEADIEDVKKILSNYDLESEMKKAGVRYRLANKGDVESLTNLRVQLCTASRNVPSIDSSEIELIRDFYLTRWDTENPPIVVLEDASDGKVVAMSAVGFGNGMPSATFNPSCRLGLIEDVVLDENLRYSSLLLTLFISSFICSVLSFDSSSSLLPALLIINL